MPRLVQLDTLEKTVQATLYSAYVKDEKPLSLLIVAKPESGKTLVLKRSIGRTGA
jgi:Cdc6-like AAA superfamily ATPase